MTQENTQESKVVFSIGISTDKANELKFALIAERESIQIAMASEARIRKVEPIVVYAEKLAADAIAERFERYDSKRIKVLENAVKVLVAGGMAEQLARTSLGLDAK